MDPPTVEFNANYILWTASMVGIEKPVDDFSHASLEVRKKWIEGVKELMTSPSETPLAPRAFNIALFPDGQVLLGTVLQPNRRSDAVYPADYRIPPETIESLSIEDQVRRKEGFAAGCLMYQLWRERKPFSQGHEYQIQLKGRDWPFPDLYLALPFDVAAMIFSCWSPEFAAKYKSGAFGVAFPFSYLTSYFRQDVLARRLFICGGVAFIGPLLAPIALLMAGFGSAGPALGSIAERLQSSSSTRFIYSFCTSVIRGGWASALLGIVGMLGGLLVALALLSGLETYQAKDVAQLVKLFTEAHRSLGKVKRLNGLVEKTE